jgi:hypothetical protein
VKRGREEAQKALHKALQRSEMASCRAQETAKKLSDQHAAVEQMCVPSSKYGSSRTLSRSYRDLKINDAAPDSKVKNLCVICDDPSTQEAVSCSLLFISAVVTSESAQ